MKPALGRTSPGRWKLCTMGIHGHQRENAARKPDSSHPEPRSPHATRETAINLAFSFRNDARYGCRPSHRRISEAEGSGHDFPCHRPEGTGSERFARPPEGRRRRIRSAPRRARGRRPSVRTACKPGSVRGPRGPVDGHSSGAGVAPGFARSTIAGGAETSPRASHAQPAFSILLPAGLAVPPPSPGARWALTPPFHPCRSQAPAVCSLWRFPSGSGPKPLPRPGVTRRRVSLEPGLSSPPPDLGPAAARPSGRPHIPEMPPRALRRNPQPSASSESRRPPGRPSETGCRAARSSVRASRRALAGPPVSSGQSRICNARVSAAGSSQA